MAVDGEESQVTERHGIHMKKLGVIGGLGPMATAYFLQLITQMSDAETDQEHMEILLHSNPRIPDRTRFILGQSEEDPLPQMVEIGIDLRSQGAEMIAVPCVTAHYFRKRLEREIGIPILDAIRETALSLRAAGIRRAGIMGTDGTIESGLFQRALAEEGITSVLPDRSGQQAVMDIIYKEVKAGRPVDVLAESIELWSTEAIKQCVIAGLGFTFLPRAAVARELADAGAQTVILACTELSLVKRDFELGDGFLDVMEVLARKAVLTCGRLNPRYECLLGVASASGERPV